MAPKNNRYKEMEQMMTALLIFNAIIFVLFLVVSGAGIVWLRVLTAILTLGLSGLCLLFLYLSQELLRQRSLWMTTGFFSLLICTVASLILAFP